MKKNLLLCLLASLFQVSLAQNISLPPSGGNQKARVIQWMGPVEVSFTYNSPDITGPGGEDRSGKIWGELVPWGMQNLGFGTAEASPWRAGANENTVFSTSHDIQVEGKSLPAGKYGFFVIPQPEGPWTLIFSSNYQSWGSYFYDPAEDVLRVQVKPDSAEFTEWLTYGFSHRKLNSCTAFLQWEKLQLPFELSVPAINQIYLSKIRNELRNSNGFTWLSWNAAASYCLQQDINLEEALSWAEQAITAPFIGQENFSTLQTKSQLLDRLGRQQEAESIMDKALYHPTATVGQIHSYARSLIAQKQPDRALEVFKMNYKTHPEDPFTTAAGLARGYEATGDLKKAIKYWEQALEVIPPHQKPYISQYEAEIQRIREKMKS